MEAASDLVAAADQVLNHEGIRWFVPHGGQAEYINLVAQSGGYIIVSGAGNGWGKSELLIAIFAAIFWPHLAPPCLSAEVFTKWPYPKRARIYSAPAELEEIGSLQSAIAKLFPRGHYEASKGRYGYPSVFHTDTGWVLDLFSYERDAAEAAGPNISLQGFNEPPPHELWKEAVARSRTGGLILGGMTSLLQNPWVVDGIFGRAAGENIRIRYGNSCENCIEHGINGHLSHDRIEKILSQYDADEREARFTGKPLVFSGRVFKTFDRAIHVARDEFEPPGDQRISIGQIVDPAIGKPLAVVWRWVDAAGVLHYYDEYPDFDFEGAKDSNLTVAEYADIFRVQEGGKAIEVRILDRHFGNVRRTNGGKTLKEEFAEAGLEFQDSYAMEEEVETGILKVKEFLRYDKGKAVDSLNCPRIVISPKCRNLIAAFERWSRDPKSGKPQERWKDFMDLVRYDVMSQPVIEMVKTWPGRRGPYYGVNVG